MKTKIHYLITIKSKYRFKRKIYFLLHQTDDKVLIRTSSYLLLLRSSLLWKYNSLTLSLKRGRDLWEVKYVNYCICSFSWCHFIFQVMKGESNPSFVIWTILCLSIMSNVRLSPGLLHILSQLKPIHTLRGVRFYLAIHLLENRFSPWTLSY